MGKPSQQVTALPRQDNAGTVAIVSFSNHARRVRDSSVPYPHRVSALRSCVEQYQPLGWHATLSYLEAVAGPFHKDEDALLRALDILNRSRLSRSAAQQAYAQRRRREKNEGRRARRNDDPDPAAQKRWFGDGARAASLHALQYEGRSGRRLSRVRASPTPKARDLSSIVDASLAAGGPLSGEQRRQVEALIHDLMTSDSRDTAPGDRYLGVDMLIAARLLIAADDGT